MNSLYPAHTFGFDTDGRASTRASIAGRFHTHPARLARFVPQKTIQKLTDRCRNAGVFDEIVQNRPAINPLTFLQPAGRLLPNRISREQQVSRLERGALPPYGPLRKSNANRRKRSVESHCLRCTGVVAGVHRAEEEIAAIAHADFDGGKAERHARKTSDIGNDNRA